MNSGASQPFMRTVTRRPAVEQKVLAILRGDGPAQDGRTPQRPPRLSERDQALFDALRDQAQAQGLHIRAPGAPFIHDDELRLLAWLAQGQRLSRDLEAVAKDRTFLALILDCSLSLKGLGLQLPARSLVNL
jgi:hypothetical protein